QGPKGENLYYGGKNEPIPDLDNNTYGSVASALENYFIESFDESEYRDMAMDEVGMPTEEGEGQYENYTMPGGTNYREQLFTLPNIGGRGFAEGHFQEPNVFAHLRMKDRLDAEGRKMLFAEEVQSDWHQQGRDRGYDEETPKQKEERDAKREDLRQQREHIIDQKQAITNSAEFERLTSTGDLSSIEEEDLAVMTKKIEALNAQHNEVNNQLNRLSDNYGRKVPEAQFKKNWHEFVMKRMLQYAVQHGYDAIGWTKGDTQNDRYSLEKTIKAISVHHDFEGKFAIEAMQHGHVYDQHIGSYTAEELPGVVGKEMAQKIIDDRALKETGATTFHGLELKTGGEGMRGFYDKILPDYLNKLGKKYGAKVEETTTPVAGFNEVDNEDEARLMEQEFGRKATREPERREPVHEKVITPELRAQVKNIGFELFQAARGRITFGDGQHFNISLLEGADRSTFIHETGHLYTQVMQDLAKETPAIAQDYQVLRDWVGAQGDAALSREQHEQIARGFEAYIMEGKAPSTALRSAFFRFKQWLTQIYHELSGLGVQLTPAVRGVFDRLIASDQEIAKAEHAAHVTPLFGDNPKAVGMNDEDQAKYATAVADAHQAAEEQLSQRLIKDMRREESRQWKQWSGPVREQVTKEVEANPTYQVLDYLTKGVTPPDRAVPAGLKLSKAALVGAYGKDILNGLPRDAITTTGGVHPDIVAQLLGFQSGREMVDAMRAAPDKEALIAQRTNQQVQAEHGARMTPEEVEQQAQA